MDHTATFDEIAHAALQFPALEKMALIRILLDERSSGHFASKENELAWIIESERRLDAYLRGERKAVDGDEALAHLRSPIK